MSQAVTLIKVVKETKLSLIAIVVKVTVKKTTKWNSFFLEILKKCISTLITSNWRNGSFFYLLGGSRFQWFSCIFYNSFFCHMLLVCSIWLFFQEIQFYQKKKKIVIRFDSTCILRAFCIFNILTSATYAQQWLFSSRKTLIMQNTLASLDFNFYVMCMVY